MPNKVVHLSDEAHAEAKHHCDKLGVKMSDWVADLIMKTVADQKTAAAIPQGAEPVTKKKLETLDNEPSDVAERAPFWASQEA